MEEENRKKNKSSFGASQNHSDVKEEDDNNDDESKIKHHDETDAILHSKKMFKALKIMERVTVLNANSVCNIFYIL